jgi:cold shock protein
MSIETGTVKWFNEGKGFGFIAPDGGGKDLFAHFKEIQGNGLQDPGREPARRIRSDAGPEGPAGFAHPTKTSSPATSMSMLPNLPSQTQRCTPGVSKVKTV